MAKIAKEYHKNLQKKAMITDKRRKAIKEIKKVITKNGTSPGIDGIPYEFYKMIVEKYESEKDGDKNPDIIKILKIVINDIE